MASLPPGLSGLKAGWGESPGLGEWLGPRVAGVRHKSIQGPLCTCRLAVPGACPSPS